LPQSLLADSFSEVRKEIILFKKSQFQLDREEKLMKAFDEYDSLKKEEIIKVQRKTYLDQIETFKKGRMDTKQALV